MLQFRQNSTAHARGVRLLEHHRHILRALRLEHRFCAARDARSGLAQIADRGPRLLGHAWLFVVGKRYRFWTHDRAVPARRSRNGPTRPSSVRPQRDRHRPDNAALALSDRNCRDRRDSSCASETLVARKSLVRRTKGIRTSGVSLVPYDITRTAAAHPASGRSRRWRTDHPRPCGRRGTAARWWRARSAPEMCRRCRTRPSPDRCSRRPPATSW